MASREETLLFLVDVQVKNSQALRQLGTEFDALQGKMDRHLETLKSANANLIEQQRGAGPIGAGPAIGSGAGQSPSQIVGIRGSHQPGSRMNPIIFAQESSAASGLGSLGQNNPGVNGGNNGPSASDIANAIQAQNPNVGGGIDPQALDQTVKEVTAKAVAPENDRVISAIQANSDAQRRIAEALGRAQTVAPPAQLTTGDAAARLNRPRSAVRDMAAEGQLAATKQNGQWLIPESEVDRMLADIENARSGAAGGGAGGGGGGGRFAIGGGGGSGGGGGGGGGGSRFQWSPFGGSRSNPDSATGGALSFANLFKGDGGRGGAFGLPGFGSIGSLGGLGLEHWILSALGVGASAGAAVGGGTLLASASLTKSVVGGGADALVNKATMNQVMATVQDYKALNQAVAEYGKGSKQAVAAQNLLNYSMSQMGGGAAQAAETQLAHNIENMTALFNKESNAARAASADVMDQVVHLATDYIPAVTDAAQRNLTIVNTSLKPLFAWLEGPQGMGIFKSMENSFAQGLPTTIHAASMAFEDFLRLMQAALPYTGGLSQALDNFFTEKNKEDVAHYDAEVQKLVGDLRLWENLLKLLGQDMGLAFKQDAGTANSIVGALTDMLQKLHDWEESSQGQSQLKTIFAVHKAQILELLTVFGHLAGDYGHFYMDVAPAMVTAVTDIAKVFNALATVLEKIPGGGEFAGLLIVMTKLGALGPALKVTAAALLGIDVAGKGGGGGGGLRLLGGGVAGKAATGAEDAAGAAEGAGGGGLLAAILRKVGGSGAGKAVAGGVEASALGVAGAAEGAGLSGLAASLTTAGAAVAPIAAGLVPILAAAGGVAGLVELFKIFNNQATSQGNQVAKNVATSLGVTPSLTKNVANDVNKSADDRQAAPSRSSTAPGRARFAPSDLTQPQLQNLGNSSAQQMTKAGLDAGKDFVTAMGSVKFPSTLQMFEQMRNTLNTLPKGAKDSAAQTMLAFAQELQSEGKLPKGAVSNLIQLLEAQFPPLRAYLKKEGLGAGQDFASGLSLTKAVTNTKAAVQNLKQEFGNIFDNSTTTSGNMLQQVTKDFETLKGNMGSLTKQGQQQASQNLAQLKQTALSDATAMEQQVSNKMGILAGNIASGSQSALNSATGDFKALANNIAAGVGSGALASGKGGQLIAEALNDQLKALGAKPIPMVALKSLSISQLLGEEKFITNGGPSNAGHGATAATGALLQIGARGQAGGDNVPLTVGNTNVIVGAGEQVAVINRHQQPIIDRALAREGYAGLPGLFSAVKTPNYMASGGFVPGFAQGGVAHGPGVTGEIATYLMAHGYNKIGAAGVIGNMAQESGGATLAGITPSITGDGGGGLVGWTPLSELTDYASQRGMPWNSLQLQLQALSAGIGGLTPLGQDASTMDSQPNASAAAAWWMNNWEHPLAATENAAGREAAAAQMYAYLSGQKIPVGSAGAGGGASWSDLTAPQVAGNGAIASLVNAALGKDTAAANAYGQKQAALMAPATSVAGGGGLTFPFHLSKGSKLPVPVQKALEIANAIVSDHPPYVLAGYSPTGTGADGYDCSGMVSSILHAAGLDPQGYMNTFGLADWGEPGRGKYITVGIVDNGADDGSWPNNIQHTMMEIAGQYFESSGHGDGPHKDSGFVYPFPIWRHPPGLAGGGILGKGQNGRIPPPGGSASVTPAMSTAEQAFIKKNKGKPKSHAKAKAPKYKLTGGPQKLDTHGLAKFGLPPIGGALPFDDNTDLSNIDAMLNAIYGLAGGADGIPGTGQILGLENDISYYTNAWGAGIASPAYPNPAGAFFGSYASPSDFVTSTTDSAGNTTYAIDPNINTVASQLAQMIGWQSGIVGDLTGANTQSGAVQGPINKAITRRVDEMAKIKKQVADNVKQITAYQKKVSDAKKKIATLKTAYKQLAVKQAAAIKTQAATVKQLNAENAKKKPNKATVASLAKQALQQQGIVDGIDSQMVQNLAQQQNITKIDIPGYQADIVPYETQNVALGGKKDSMGTGGQWGTLSGEVGTAASGASGIGLAEGSGAAASGLYGLLSTVQSWQAAIGGTNGDLAQQGLTLTEWQGDYTNLIPGANAALLADNTSASTAANSTNPITGTVAFQFNGNEVLASTLQGMAQGGMLPWAGSFMTGGVIPGPIGASALAEVHGGEVITNPYLPGAGAGGSEATALTGAVNQLCNAMVTHTAAVNQNTQAVTSHSASMTSTGGGAGFKYSGRAYDAHTSSDSVIALGVGS